MFQRGEILMVQSEILLFDSGRQNLAAAVLARLQVDMVRTTTLAAVLVFDVCPGGQGIVRTPLSPLHRRGFFARNCH